MAEIEQRIKSSDSWFRKLAHERLEVCLVGRTTDEKDIRIRMSGPPETVWEIVEWFEDRTGIHVQGDWRRPPRRGPRVMAGQQSLLMDERPSDGESDASGDR